jgi:hypothetical protein
MNKTPFPPEIEELILKRQVEAGNKADITVYYRIQQADKDDGGFSWSNTKEGHTFWSSIFNERNYKPFYDKYPQTQTKYKGLIVGFPKEIVDLLLERFDKKQLIPGKTKLESLEIKGVMGAFDWCSSPEKSSFWIDIDERKFETFYKRYPKGTQTLTNEESRSKNEQITIVDSEQCGKGIACFRSTNQKRKVAIGSELVGDSNQNRVVNRRIARSEIGFEAKFR